MTEPSAGASNRKRAMAVLHEGFAIPGDRKIRSVAKTEDSVSQGGGPKPYGRGASTAALEQMSDPDKCMQALLGDVSAENTKGPTASRKQLWASLANKAGYDDPFHLEPELIYKVMGSLKLANFRSAQLYLDNAKAQHIASGHPWTEQLKQSYRAAVRSCQRNLGQPKQAAPLPITQLATLPNDIEPAQGGPSWPARSALLCSWWLLREIEASHAVRSHITVDNRNKLISWRLPSSKTDFRALGATRNHSCSCEFSPPEQCPYHRMVEHLLEIGVDDQDPIFPSIEGTPATKQGWADTFELLGDRLGLPTKYPNGARCFTGHTARASGAVHLAASNIEPWRIQLFGRWGSQVFIQYIKDAPLKQMDKLALESSVHLSIETAKIELQNLIRKAESGLKHTVACPSPEMLQDCTAALQVMDPPKPTDAFIHNTSGGKVHRALVYADDIHPREWKTRCAWHFGGQHTMYEVTKVTPNEKTACRKCFPEFRSAVHEGSDSSSTDSDSSSSH